MEEFETNKNLNIKSSSVETLVNDINSDDIVPIDTEMVEYKEVEKPCVALTIIGENKLTDTEVFIRRGIKYSIKAFFSAIVLTIMNLFI